jgi:hypothetical protein
LQVSAASQVAEDARHSVPANFAMQLKLLHVPQAPHAGSQCVPQMPLLSPLILKSQIE